MGASWIFLYAPTYILASGNGTPVLPIAFSAHVIGIENAKTADIHERCSLNFIGMPMMAEEINMPEAILNYIAVNKEELKKKYGMVHWDRFI
jgi:hypothetical protein